VKLILVASLSLFIAASAHAQNAPQSASRYPRVCAAGVKVYDDVKQIPAPHDTLKLPPAEPVRVTNPAEAEAAELALRDRAGSVGATGVLIATEESNENGNLMMRRRVVAVFARADSAAAQKACAK
jgi:hypothetical protein